MNRNISKQLKGYLWVFYPVFVVLMITFTWSYVAGGPDKPWFRMLQTSKKVQEQDQLASQLETKLQQLQSTNPAEVSRSLAELATAMPASKQIDLVVAQLRQAALESGSSLSSYSSNVGDLQLENSPFTLTAKLTVTDISALEKLLASLETKLPLVEIVSVDFIAPQLTLEVKQVWAPLASLAPAIEEPLPDYQGDLQIVKSQLTGFATVGIAPVVETASDSAQPQLLPIDPFTPAN